VFDALAGGTVCHPKGGQIIEIRSGGGGSERRARTRRRKKPWAISLPHHRRCLRR
jgi:hypothetical protein